jgi:hypothetical protein
MNVSYVLVFQREGFRIERTDEASVTSIIPQDESNIDYQVYLEWLAQGNTPEEFNNGL